MFVNNNLGDFMNRKEIFDLSLDIGKCIIKSGGEISRAKETIIRINHSVKNECEVFALPSVIIAQSDDLIQIRHIKNTNDDLELLSRLNNYSRTICSGESTNYSLDAKNEYKQLTNACAIFLATFAFCIFFGGSIFEAIVSGAIGLIISFINIQKYSLPLFTNNIICSFISSVLAYLPSIFGLYLNADKIIIGTIMLLVPGLTTVSAIRDMMNGDLIAGMFELFSAIMSALAIAFGVAGGIWVMSWF